MCRSFLPNSESEMVAKGFGGLRAPTSFFGVFCCFVSKMSIMNLSPFREGSLKKEFPKGTIYRQALYDEDISGYTPDRS